MNLGDVRRRLFDLLASSIGRYARISEWVYLGRAARLPISIETTPDASHVFRARISVPPANPDLRWVLKFVASGNAIARVDGELRAGLDEAHTYIPIEPGEHSVEVVFSPRGLFGYHRWSFFFENAYLVEVAWQVLGFSLRALKLLEFIENIRSGSQLREDLEKLLYSLFREVRLNPSLRQIALANILLYGSVPAPYFKRDDVPKPYEDYSWIAGVYGIGALNGSVSDVESEDVRRSMELSRRLEEELRSHLYEIVKKHGKPGVAYAVGHSHIDAAWLWPRSETILKVLRTFSTVLNLLRDYEFTYVQSSAQYYEWVEERAPDIFEKMRRFVELGRWIIVGGMWIESDTQLVDGESLVRQFLYGQRYFMSKFNRVARVGWLPDSFGFSGNLPQLMKLSGIEVFVTHKVVWNDTNEFPYHTFVWRGIDGTEIPTQVIVLSYGEPLTPASLHRYWERYRNKDQAPFIVYAYGYSDGGGGPTREMLELVELNNAVPDIPRVRHFNEVEYIEALRKARGRLPVWSGEMYVEVHRGTYTTNLKIKELVARAEIELLQAETASAVADILKLRKADRSTLSNLWKLLLFNEFHDIVPGSSIREVYDDSTRDLEYVIESSKLITRRALEAVSRYGLSRKNLVVFNTLPWRRRAIIEVEKGVGVPYGSGGAAECQDVGERLYVAVELPPLGYRVMELTEAPCASNHGVSVYERGDGVVLENESVVLEIDREGNIAFLKLKSAGEVFREPSNRLVAHVDKPGTWDAWDIREDFLYEGVELEAVSEPRVTVRGPLVSCVNFAKGFENSVIHQEICLHKNSPVVSVRSRFSWNSKGVLVKAWFTLRSRDVRAFFDIPYGVVERSTKAESTWDRARYEVPSLRWVDLVGEEVSLAIIAPSRHGYSVRGDRVGLSLLRSPTFPNPWSDLGVSETTYYLYPHVGSYEDAEVPRVSQELLHAAKTATVGADVGEVALLEVEPPLVFGSLKPSEDVDGYVVRLFNPYRRTFKTRVRVSPVVNVSKILEVDLLEMNVLRELELQEGVLEIELEPFKLVTLKLVVR